uniref:Vesicle-associated membrane protein 4 n=1 Tax=Fundulus heteroclitus TaxID=8078 RepID=A0A3Q2NMX3_FUNHE
MREPEREQQPEDNMPPKFKRHLNDDEVTGSIRSERRNLLEEDSDEEEDFFLRGPTGPRFGPQNDKMKHVQSQVDEVIDVMQENISKVIERGERLEDLQDKSDEDDCCTGSCCSAADHYHSSHPSISLVTDEEEGDLFLVLIPLHLLIWHRRQSRPVHPRLLSRALAQILPSDSHVRSDLRPGLIPS